MSFLRNLIATGTGPRLHKHSRSVLCKLHAAVLKPATSHQKNPAALSLTARRMSDASSLPTRPQQLLCWRDTGRRVATLEAVQGLLQRETEGASAQPVECISDSGRESLPMEPLAREALALLEQSLRRRSTASPAIVTGSRELSGTL